MLPRREVFLGVVGGATPHNNTQKDKILGIPFEKQDGAITLLSHI
jgi:hypothetical protein